MKRLITILLLLFTITTNVTCENIFSEQVTFVSSYLYHGKRYGGLSMQPSVSFNYKGIYGCLWANVGAFDYSFKIAGDEVDFVAGYINYGVSVVYKHMILDELTLHKGYLTYGYNLGYYTPLNLTIEAETAIYNGNIGTTYISYRYDFVLPYDIVISPELGMNIENKQCSLQCVECKMLKKIYIKHHSLNVFFRLMYNPLEKQTYNAFGVAYCY